jgi:hypothetical protein
MAEITPLIFTCENSSYALLVAHKELILYKLFEREWPQKLNTFDLPTGDSIQHISELKQLPDRVVFMMLTSQGNIMYAYVALPKNLDPYFHSEIINVLELQPKSTLSKLGLSLPRISLFRSSNQEQNKFQNLKKIQILDIWQKRESSWKIKFSVKFKGKVGIYVYSLDEYKSSYRRSCLKVREVRSTVVDLLQTIEHFEHELSQIENDGRKSLKEIEILDLITYGFSENSTQILVVYRAATERVSYSQNNKKQRSRVNIQVINVKMSEDMKKPKVDLKLFFALLTLPKKFVSCEAQAVDLKSQFFFNISIDYVDEISRFSSKIERKTVILRALDSMQTYERYELNTPVIVKKFQKFPLKFSTKKS